MNRNWAHIKQNAALLVVLTVTGTLSLFLIYLALDRHAAVNESYEKIDGYKSELISAHAKKPAPVRLNAVKISRDAAKLKKLNIEIEKCFGMYYRAPLLEFAERIAIPEDELLGKFRTFYEKLPQDRQGDLLGGTKDKVLLQGFLDSLLMERLSKPFSQFDAALKNSKSKEVFDTQFNLALAEYAKQVREPVETLGKGLQLFIKKLDASLKKYQKDLQDNKVKSASAPDFRGILNSAAEAVQLDPQTILLFFQESPDDILGLKADDTHKLKDTSMIKAYLFQVEKKKQDISVRKFYSAIRKKTVQEITPENNYGFLLAAFGLPRTERIVVFSETLKKYKQRLLKAHLIPGADEMQDVEAMTFPDNFPRQATVPEIIRQMIIREDIFRRLKRNKIIELTSIQPLSPLAGTVVQERYLEFKYKMTMIGTISAIRNLIDDMQRAVSENVVFVVRDIRLKRTATEDLQKLTTEDSAEESIRLAQAYQFKTKDSSASVSPLTGTAQGNDTKKDELAEKRILASTYGKPQVGANNELSAEITFSVFLYTGNEVKRIKNEK